MFKTVQVTYELRERLKHELSLLLMLYLVRKFKSGFLIFMKIRFSNVSGELRNAILGASCSALCY